mgnify:CR=1 FL=1
MSKVLIIGSGIGGLLAGNLLARKGHQVTIFESHSAPGGYIGGFWRKGFYFESGTLSFESSKMVFGAMKDLGLWEKINFTRLYTRWVNKEFDGSMKSYGEFKAQLISAYPEEEANLKRYFAEVDRLYYATLPFIKSEDKPLLRLIPQLIAAGFQMARLSRKYAKVNLSDFTAKFFTPGSKLERFFSIIGYPKMATTILGGAYASLFEDYWAVSDGMQSWADLLSANFQKLGGELKLNSYVNRIITHSGKAIGVSCRKTVYAADYVIAAGDYKKTFLRLLDDRTALPADFLTRVEQTAVSEGNATAYLGLSMSNEELRTYLKLPHVCYFEDHPGAEVSDPQDREYFEKCGVTIYSLSLQNPKLAPEGKSSLMILAFAPTGWQDNWGDGDWERYRQLKAEVLEALIDKAGEIIPHLRDRIEFSDLATPLTYERYTHNTGGASSAWSWNPENRFYKSLLKSYVDTPIKNLYIGSCWAMQIGGIPGAISAAYNCAKRIK